MDDIALLESTGFELQVDGASAKVTAVLVAFSGDNLSMNRLAGVTCCFSSGHPCRFCTLCVDSMDSVVHEKYVCIRTADLHQTHLRSVGAQRRSRECGVFSVPPLLEMTTFDVTLQLRPDLMHDLLEGSMVHVLRQVLCSLISDKVLTLSNLERVTTFDYGYNDRKTSLNQ